MPNALFDLDPTGEECPDLPPLRGTVNQVPWATSVRKAKLAECRKVLRDWQAVIDSHKRTGRNEAATREERRYREAVEGLARLEREDTCRWWLDHRENTALELLNGSEAKPGRGDFPG